VKRAVLLLVTTLIPISCVSSGQQHAMLLTPKTEMQSQEAAGEQALALIHDCLKRHGYQSRPIDKTTHSGFLAALRYSKPGAGTFYTYTHEDLRLAIA
jgi:hypothetical protein